MKNNKVLNFDDKRGNVKDVFLNEALGDRYLRYALSTIVSRSLPDVRDGLKPVHRRILYAMKESGNHSDRSYRKSANPVGYVMMKYHPHGDGAIYDALVRMAQDFSMRYPLIDGQGNFGSIDGDKAAAMRYTEARLTVFSESLIFGIDEDTVDFRLTYTGKEKEPIVLPANFPNLLANGASGIAVGMATNIPSHNIAEICDALVYLIKYPDCTIDKLLKFIKGPDFPTGGVIVSSTEEILRAYTLGKGGIKLRAQWEVENLKGGQYRIIINEIPYQVQKSKLIERIALLLSDRKVPLLSDIYDESTAKVRIVLIPKSHFVDSKILMEALFRLTDLEVNFHLNMNVLDKESIPKVMNLSEVLKAFLDHKHEVLYRRSAYNLNHIKRRIEILEGYKVVYLNIDEVIRIIREEKDPKKALINRWSLTEIQVDAILNMKLKSLKKLEEQKISIELKKLIMEMEELSNILKEEHLRWKIISKEIKSVKKKYGDSRRTVFGSLPEVQQVPIEAMIEVEPMTVFCSAKGWIKVVKGHVEGDNYVKYKEGDKANFIFHVQSIDNIALFISNGRFYTLSVDKLSKGRGYGEPVRLLIDIKSEDKVVNMFILSKELDRKFLLVCNNGKGFLISEKNIIAHKRVGKQILDVNNSVGTHCVVVKGDYVATIGENRKLLLFHISNIPEMTKGKGVILQRFKSGSLSDIKVINLNKDGLTWRKSEKLCKAKDTRLWLGLRGQGGRLAPHGFPKDNKFN